MLLLHWYLTENQKGPFRTTINCYQLLLVTLILLAFRLLFLKGNRYMTNYKKNKSKLGGHKGCTPNPFVVPQYC